MKVSKWVTFVVVLVVCGWVSADRVRGQSGTRNDDRDSDRDRKGNSEGVGNYGTYALPRPVRGEVPIGTIMAFAAPQDSGQEEAVQDWLADQGWMLCDGRPLRESQAPLLFAVLGTSHGAGHPSGGTDDVPDAQFNIPDYRGRFLRGVSRETGRDPDAASRGEMNGEGNEGDLVGSIQGHATARPSGNEPMRTNVAGEHEHSGRTDRDGEHSHQIPHDNGNPGGGRYALDRVPNHRMTDNTQHVTTDDGEHRHTFTTGPAGRHDHTVDGGGDAETRPVNANVNWIIKYRYIL